MRYNNKEKPITIVYRSMKDQNWTISCIKNITISEDIAIFSDVSKRCNILLSQYIAIKKRSALVMPCPDDCKYYNDWIPKDKVYCESDDYEDYGIGGSRR